MKHVVKPFMDQSINQAIDRNDSQAEQLPLLSFNFRKPSAEELGV